MDTTTERMLYSIPHAAEVCDLGKSKLWELVSAGEIPSIKIGRARRIPAKELHAWIARQIAQGNQSEHVID